MGLFGSIGKGLKKVAGFVGNVAQKASPLLGLTGIGLPLAAGIGAGGALLKGIGGGKVKLADIAKGAATGGLSAGAGKLLKGGGASGGSRTLQNSVAGYLPGGPSGASPTVNNPEALEGALNEPRRGPLSRIGEWFSADPQRAAELGLGAANVYQGWRAQSHANKYRNAALDHITPPLREDLSGIFGADYGTPATGRRRASLRALQGG